MLPKLVTRNLMLCLMLQVCNSSQFNAAYGCWYCEQPGDTWFTATGHNTYFPYIPGDPKGPKRTTDSINRDANIANERRSERRNLPPAKTAEKGIKGTSWFSFLDKFDIVNGMVVDSMHCLYAGIMLMLLNIWFNKDAKFKKPGTSYVDRIPGIDKLIYMIKPLLNIRRPPRTLLDIGHWKCSELRNFLLYWGYPLLKDVLSEEHFAHFCLLIRAVHNLSKDVITEEDLLIAEECLNKFVLSVGALYGGRYMTMNVHSLLHLVDSVRSNGPLFTCNCFVFEDLNGYLMDCIHGTLGVDTQLVNTICLLQSAPILKESFINNCELQVLYDKLSGNKLHDGQLVHGNGNDVFLASPIDYRNLNVKECAAVLNTFGANVKNVQRFKRVYMKNLNSNICASSYKRLEKRDQFHIKCSSVDGNNLFAKVLDFIFVPAADNSTRSIVLVKPVGACDTDKLKIHDITDYVDLDEVLAISFDNIISLIQLVKTPNSTTVIELANTYDVD